MVSYAIEPLGPGRDAGRQDWGEIYSLYLLPGLGREETLAGRVIPERRYERGPAR